MEARLKAGTGVLILTLLSGITLLAQTSQGEDGLLANHGPSRPAHMPGQTEQRRAGVARIGAGITFRIPQDQPTIQSGIDAASDGDTVLVSEGTYFEQIRYWGKAIVVASLYLIDGDTSHVANTIIDGSDSKDRDSGSVVYFVDGEDTTSVLCGFTIQGGYGTRWEQGYARLRVGGGILCLASGARVVSNIITGNRVIAPTAAGGGLAAENPGPDFPLIILEDNRFTDNSVSGDSVDTWGFGGGADLWRVRVRLMRNVFERNTVDAKRRAGGGGISFGGVHPSRFTQLPVVSPGPFPDGLVLENIFRNNQVTAGNHGGVGGGVAIDATAATTIADNLFEGNVAMSGTGWALGGALAVKDESANGHGRKLITKNRFRNNQAFSPAPCESRSLTAGGGALELFHTTATISGNLFAGNKAASICWFSGGAINADYSSFEIDGNKFIDNVGQVLGGEGGVSSSGDGGALSTMSGPPHGGEQVVFNNLFSGNVNGNGGAIGVWQDLETPRGIVVIAHNTIVGNRAQSGVAGGILVVDPGVRLIINNILWENRVGMLGGLGNEIDFWNDATAHILHNDITGGWQTGIGNINVPPGFADGSFSLSDTSACIGAGIDSVQIDDVVGWFRAPQFDFSGSLRPNPVGSRPDIGAWENPLDIGANQSALLPSPISIDFRNVRPGGAGDTLTVALFNRTTIDRDILSMSLTNNEYRLAPAPSLPLRVPAYRSVGVGVLFSPIAPGQVVHDTLVITTGDLARPDLNIPLAGRGSAPVRCAGAGTLYGVSSTADGPVLYTIDKKTGSGQLVGPFSPCPSLGLCAFTVRHRDTTLYGAFTSLAGTDLYRFSSAFGDAEFAGTIPVGDVTSMAFDTSDALYMVTAQGELYRWRFGGSDTALVGPAEYPLTGLAFNPATNVLWGSLHDSLFTLDLLTGAATLRGTHGQHVQHSSIAFNGHGTMYGLYANSLMILDEVTGEPSLIGVTGVPGLVALAMRSDIVTGVEDEDGELVNVWELSQNYPNPFNPTTVIRYEIGAEKPGSATDVRLVVYDLPGRRVAELVHERQVAGRHEVRFDATGLASGIYLYRLTAGSFAQTRRMTLVK